MQWLSFMQDCWRQFEQFKEIYNQRVRIGGMNMRAAKLFMVVSKLKTFAASKTKERTV